MKHNGKNYGKHATLHFTSQSKHTNLMCKTIGMIKIKKDVKKPKKKHTSKNRLQYHNSEKCWQKKGGKTKITHLTARLPSVLC